jgi:hypothetical protein
MTITETIRQHINALPQGEPFTAKQLLRFGPRAAVDQALSRLCRAGSIHRVSRGIYARPEVGRWGGLPLPVELPKVLGIIASANGEVIAAHGAFAVNRFGLSTQNQRRPVFLTSGRSREVVIENETVSLRHVNAKHLPFGNAQAGLALTAMRYLGRQLKPEQVQRIRSQLQASEWQQLEAALGAQPGWLIETVYREHALSQTVKP